jgi:hypothetical protein
LAARHGPRVREERGKSALAKAVAALQRGGKISAGKSTIVATPGSRRKV